MSALTREEAVTAEKMLAVAWEMLVVYRAYVFERTGWYRPHADDIEMYGNIMAADEDGNLHLPVDEAIVQILMAGETLGEIGSDRMNITNDLTVHLLEELGLWTDAP